MHGYFYDCVNFGREQAPYHGTICDFFTMDVCNRFPIEVEKRFKDRLPVELVDSLRKMTNIRPSLAIPLWISGQIRSNATSTRFENEIKEVWDDIADEFLQLPYVREADRAFKFDIVDAMKVMIKISGHASFSTIDEVVSWVHAKMWGGEHSFASHVLREPSFLNGSAQFIVYGHTHHPEIIPLDTLQNRQSQLYFNSGTWHSYYDLAVRNLKEQKFIPYQAITYLTFYKENEHDGRSFESWSGAYA